MTLVCVTGCRREDAANRGVRARYARVPLIPTICSSSTVSARGAISYGGALPRGGAGRSTATFRAVRAFASDATPRPYSLATIAANPEPEVVPITPQSAGDSIPGGHLLS
jgi:hypothetical protein